MSHRPGRCEASPRGVLGRARNLRLRTLPASLRCSLLAAGRHDLFRRRPLKQLWAPWRLEYIQGADEEPGCILCLAAEANDEEGLIVKRGELAFVLLNKFPYASGHLMIAPYRHESEFGELAPEEAAEIHGLASAGLAALAETMEPQGFNLGWNLGRVAGAGVVDHVHLHVVPRWAGDTNFMPVLADVKVLPEHLLETRRKLAAAWPA